MTQSARIEIPCGKISACRFPFQHVTLPHADTRAVAEKPNLWDLTESATSVEHLIPNAPYLLVRAACNLDLATHRIKRSVFCRLLRPGMLVE